MAAGRIDLTRTHGSIYTNYYATYSAVPDQSGNFSMITVWVYGDKSSASNEATRYTATTTVSISDSTPYSQQEVGIYVVLNPGTVGYLLFAKAGYKVPHNPDGSKSVTISINMDGNTVAQASGSATVSLDTIPRETNLPSFSAGYVEDTYNLLISPQINNAKHSVKIGYGNLQQWLQSNGTLGSSEVKLSGNNLPITIPAEYYSQFDTPSGTGRMYLYTYSNDAQVGGKDKEIKISCNPSRCSPIIDATVVDTNELTLALTNDPNTVVANASEMLITPTIQISDPDDTNARVTSKSVDGTVFTTDTAMMLGPTKKDFLLSVTNNRGFTSQKTISAIGDLIPYILLTFNIDELYRPESTGSEIVLKYSGKFYSGEFATGVPNELTLWWKYKTGNNEYIDGGTLTPIIDSEKNTYSGEVTLGDGFDYQNQYDFQFFYKDKIIGINDDTFVPGTVTRGIPVFWWTADSFHVQGNLYVEGEINPTN